eukprot:76389_1
MSSVNPMHSRGQTPTSSSVISITGSASLLSNTDILSSRQWFGQFGDIQTVVIVQNRHGNKRNKTAYIQYQSVESATSAIQTMHQYQVPDTNDMLRVRHSHNQLCLSFTPNHEECKLNTINKQKHDSCPVQRTFYDIERAMFEEEIAMLKGYIESVKHAHALNEDKVNSKALQEENDRIRVKHCVLIRDFNVLEQKYSKMCGFEQDCAAAHNELKAMKTNHEALQRQCLWLKHQLQALVTSNLELQKCVFKDGSPVMVQSCHDQVEGAMEGRWYSSDC